jgi:hypothetical protein
MPKVFKFPNSSSYEVVVDDCWLKKLSEHGQEQLSERNIAELGITILADKPGVVTCRNCGAIWGRQDGATFKPLRSLNIWMDTSERAALLTPVSNSQGVES